VEVLFKFLVFLYSGVKLWHILITELNRAVGDWWRQVEITPWTHSTGCKPQRLQHSWNEWL